MKGDDQPDDEAKKSSDADDDDDDGRTSKFLANPHRDFVLKNGETFLSKWRCRCYRIFPFEVATKRWALQCDVLTEGDLMSRWKKSGSSDMHPRDDQCELCLGKVPCSNTACNVPEMKIVMEVAKHGKSRELDRLRGKKTIVEFDLSNGDDEGRADTDGDEAPAEAKVPGALKKRKAPPKPACATRARRAPGGERKRTQRRARLTF